MELMETWYGAAMAQPHPVTLTGGLIHFQTDMEGLMQITGSGNITIAGKNLYNYLTDTHGKYITSSGAIGNTYTGYDWSMSEYIPVIPGDKITYFGLSATGSAPYSAWYKADKTLVSTFKQNTGRNVLSVPQNACFVRFSIQHPGTNIPNLRDPYTFAVMVGEQPDVYSAYTGTTATAGTARKSLVGINNVWSDSGNITVTYWTH